MGASTVAIANITALNTVTLQDAFQFDPDGTWTFLDQAFHMEVKASRDDTTALASWTSAAGQIVIDDVANRVLHLNVPEADLQADLPVGEYVYDLVMFDTSVPPIRTPLMQGLLCITQGVTES